MSFMQLDPPLQSLFNSKLLNWDKLVFRQFLEDFTWAFRARVRAHVKPHGLHSMKP
jgi:hypothetical protein